MLILLGVLLVLTGSFLAIIGLLGAIGAGFQLRMLPGRSVTAIAGLREQLASANAEAARPASKRSKAKSRSKATSQTSVAAGQGAAGQGAAGQGAAGQGAAGQGAADAPAPPRPTRVVVRGRVSTGPGGVYTAPLSGGACAWYLATQTVAAGEERSTVDRFAAQPFTLTDSSGERVLVGPVCPALEQIAPAAREVRPDPHPWFDEAPVGEGQVEVYEFTLTEGQDVLASGDLSAAPDGTLRIGGEVVLSAPTAETTAGDPARAALRRDFKMATAGLCLVCAGALILGTSQHSTINPDTLHKAVSVTVLTPR